MAHEDFDGNINTLLDEFGVAIDVMIGFVAQYLDGTLSAPEAEVNIEDVGDALRAVGRGWCADVIPRVYADGVTEALRGGSQQATTLEQQDHAAMLGLSQRRLERRLTHAVDGLVVDALDRLDEAVEADLAPLRVE